MPRPGRPVRGSNRRPDAPDQTGSGDHGSNTLVTAAAFAPAYEFTITQPPRWSPDLGRTWLANAPLLNPNTTIRWHWTKQAGLRKAWRERAAQITREHAIPPLGRARLELILHIRNRRVGERHNYPSGASVKALIDGLVDAGITPDDHDEHLEVLMPRLAGLQGGRPRVDVRLWPLPGGNAPPDHDHLPEVS
jgi:hypothetical protein